MLPFYAPAKFVANFGLNAPALSGFNFVDFVGFCDFFVFLKLKWPFTTKYFLIRQSFSSPPSYSDCCKRCSARCTSLLSTPRDCNRQYQGIQTSQ